jgi:23S rRNA-/tRNA-specific pseudouridylate synthase
MDQLPTRVHCQTCGQCFPSRNKLFMHVHSDHHGQKKSETLEETKNDFLKPVTIVHENQFIRVVLKPQGLPTMGMKGETLLKHNILLISEHCQPGMNYRKAIPCHRLDSATGGLVLCSKSREAERALKLCFRRKIILKKYCAIIPGELITNSGFLLSKIDGSVALTYFQVNSVNRNLQYGVVSTIFLWPITGRRHQLRKQFRDLKHPLIGDPRYSKAVNWPNEKQYQNLFLWALELVFPVPELLMKSFCSPLNELRLENDVVEEDGSDLDDEEDAQNFMNSCSPVSVAELPIIPLSFFQFIENYLQEHQLIIPHDPQGLEVLPFKINIEQFFHLFLQRFQITQNDIIKVSIPEPSYYESFRNSFQQGNENLL